MSRARLELVWEGDKFEAKARQAVAVGTTATAAALANVIATNFGTEGGGVVGADASPLAGGPTTNRKRLRKRARYIAAPPGAFPGVRSSNLRNSIAFSRATPENLQAAAGTNLARSPDLDSNGRPVTAEDVDRYALYLEFGTSKMPARPFLLRSLRENTAMLHRIFINTTAKEMARGKAK